MTTVRVICETTIAPDRVLYAARDFTDNEIFVQYILTIGAHGAHKF